MRRILGILLLAVLLAGMTPGLAQEATDVREVMPPGFDYHSLGPEAAKQVYLRYDGVRVAGGLFILEDGYMSLGYERGDDYIAPLEAGAALTYLNSDLSVRWVLADERLEGVLYSALQELDGALLLGTERKLPGIAQEWVSSLMLVDQATGHIRWQLESSPHRAISDCWGDGKGLIYVASSGSLLEETADGGQLTVLDEEEGGLVWQMEYQQAYGVEGLMDVCPLGEAGLLLYGTRDGGEIVLYTDRHGNVRGWFAFQPWYADVNGYSSLYLLEADGQAAYLAGWEMIRTPGDIPYEARTLCMMRIDKDTFASPEE